MRQDERAPFVAALEHARISAYDDGQFVGQESFMRASEILSLAVHAGVGPGVSVLDLCCGVAGPGRLVTRELGCAYLGVDHSESAIEIARERTTGLDCSFEVHRVPPLPAGTFDVVLLLETLLAFPDKRRLVSEVAAVLTAGGRFAFTWEEGAPLTVDERATMPDADTVWLTPLAEMVALLEADGLHLTRIDDLSAAHQQVVESLIHAFEADASRIADQVGQRAVDELLTAHRLWRDWLRDGRVRKFAAVALRS